MAARKPDRIYAALEEASALIARLDARISASSLAEAWQVRATFLAAERLAEIDRTPTRSGDILGVMMGAPLPSPEAYRPAMVGFGHWRRCMARIAFSDIADRLLGRTPSPTQVAIEAQSAWDMEDDLPFAARQALARQPAETETVDSYALNVSQRALEQLRGLETTGSRFWSLAEGLKQAIRYDPDPGYFDRIWPVRQRFEAEARARRKGPLPSPGDADPVEDFISSVDWDKKSHLGACFAVVPDRLQDMGLCANRLSCLTGATRRLGFEGLLDERSFHGFLSQLAQEARSGLALLDGLEGQLAELGRSAATKCDPRSPLPKILYAFLLLPVVDSPWLQSALQLQENVTSKHVKRMADAGLIVAWGERAVSGVGRVGRPITLWSAARLQDDFVKTGRRRSSWVRPGVGPIDPAELLQRNRDIDVSIPMSIVYARFDDELADLDKLFGRFFDREWLKNRPPPAGHTAPRRGV